MEFWYKLEYKIEESGITFKAFKLFDIDCRNIRNSSVELCFSIEGVISNQGDMSFKQNGFYSHVSQADQTLGIIKEVYKIADNSYKISEIYL